MQRAASIEPRITVELQQIAERTDARLIGTHVDQAGVRLSGLEYRLKTTESLYRKIATELGEIGDPRSVATVDAKLNVTGDAVRYTYVIPDEAFGAGVNSILEQLGEAGIRWTGQGQWKLTFGKPDVYQGINSQWHSPDGQRFEIQFHTESSLHAKEMTHPWYEEARLPETSEARRRELNEAQAGAFNAVPLPKGIEIILPPRQ